MRLLFVVLAALFSLSFISSSRAGDELSLFKCSSARPAPVAVRGVFGSRSGKIRYDARMIRAAQIAQQRAHARTTWYCWRYVKNALLAAGVISSRPETASARRAGEELSHRFGFRKLPGKDPRQAPVGAVIVYGGKDAGHVEIRTAHGYVSDFTSRTPYPRPVLGIYVKPA